MTEENRWRVPEVESLRQMWLNGERSRKRMGAVIGRHRKLVGMKLWRMRPTWDREERADALRYDVDRIFG